MNSNNIDLARLRATLDTAELSWLISRLRQRLERGEGLEGVVTLRDPTPGQRAAVDRLLGRRPSGGATLTLDLMDLDRQLRHAELCDGLPAAIEALCGPLENLREQQLQGEQQWQRLFAEAAHRAGASRDLQLWLDELRATGLLRRLSGQQLDAARRLLDQTFDLLARLPARGLPLAELAVAVSGDSHTLDPGRPLATIALRAAAQLAGVDHRHDAEARRDAWAGVGVLCDELSAPLLLLNLRGDNGSLTGRALSSHAESGEPYRLSVRQWLRHPAALDLKTVGPAVYVCENPSVVAAAANRLGAHGAPLICLEGQPKTAARLLLTELARHGVRLLYHGDFDWSGIRIANLVIRRHGAWPWRMGADDYLRCAGGAPLLGSPLDADWDSHLRPAMEAAGQGVHEEQVLDDLIEDLAAQYLLGESRPSAP